MPIDDAFLDLIRRVRARDEAAAAALVCQYEDYVRREVRIWLLQDRRRGLIGSMDIIQEVWASFFVHAALGAYDLAHPAQLVKLLQKMAAHKLAQFARRFFVRKSNLKIACCESPIFPGKDPRTNAEEFPENEQEWQRQRGGND